MLTEIIIPNPTDTIKYCYESLIFNQHIASTILEDCILEVNDSESKEDAGFLAWIKKQFQKIAVTIRKWVTSIVNFFTKTLPNAIANFVDKILRFLKIRKTKTIKMPENVTEKDKENIKKAASIVNKEVQKELAKATIASNANIQSEEKKVNDAISKIENGEVSKELDQAFKARYILVFGNDDGILPTYKTKCKKLSGPLNKTLNAIAVFCDNGKKSLQDFTNKLQKELSDPIIMDNLNNTDAADQFRDMMAKFLKKTYANNKAGMVNKGKMYSREQMDKIPRENINVEDVKKELANLRNNKNASIICNATKAQADGLLKMIDVFLSYFKSDTEKNKAKKYTNVYVQYQNHVMKVITDATNDYTSYLNYAINEYKEAIAGTFNMNTDKLDYEDS